MWSVEGSDRTTKDALLPSYIHLQSLEETRLGWMAGMALELAASRLLIARVFPVALNVLVTAGRASLAQETALDEVFNESSGLYGLGDGLGNGGEESVDRVEKLSFPIDRAEQKSHSQLPTSPVPIQLLAKDKQASRNNQRIKREEPAKSGENLSGWPNGNDTSVSTLLHHLTCLEDVLVVHNHVKMSSNIWKLLHTHTRSLEISQLQYPRSIAVPRRTPHSTCLYLFKDSGRRPSDIRDSARLLDVWSERCRRLLVVETLQPAEQSLAAQLVRYDHTQMTLSVMMSKDGAGVGEDGDDAGSEGDGGEGDADDYEGGGNGNVQRVYGFRTDCIRHKKQPELLWDSAWKRRRAQGFHKHNTTFHQENAPYLRGQHLRVTSTAPADTYYAYLPDPSDQSHIAGVEKNMLDTVADHLGFSYSYIPPPSGAGLFGSRLENGSWTGVVGMVSRGEADIAIGDISVTLERLGAVDYTYPHQVEPNSFIMLRPAPLPRWLAVATPFDLPTWFLLALALGTALLAASLPGVRTKSRHGTQAAALFLFGALVNQSGTLPVKAASGRTLVAAWWVFGLTIAISYQSRLTSLLSISTYPPTIDSLDQLARSQLQVKAIPHVVVAKYLESFAGTDSALAGLASRLSYFSITDTLEDMKFEPDTAYIEELSLVRRAAMERPNPSRYYVSRARFYATGLAWPVPHGACFKAPLNTVIQRLLQAGLVEFWLEKEGGQVGSTPLQPPPDQRALRLADLGAAFLVLIAGSTTSVLCFLLEILFEGRRRRRQAGLGMYGKAR